MFGVFEFSRRSLRRGRLNIGGFEIEFFCANEGGEHGWSRVRWIGGGWQGGGWQGGGWQGGGWQGGGWTGSGGGFPTYAMRADKPLADFAVPRNVAATFPDFPNRYWDPDLSGHSLSSRNFSASARAMYIG